jgi:hypothetical protein
VDRTSLVLCNELLDFQTESEILLIVPILILYTQSEHETTAHEIFVEKLLT